LLLERLQTTWQSTKATHIPLHSTNNTNNTLKNKDIMRYFYPANLALLIALSSFAAPGFAQAVAFKPLTTLGQTATPSGWKDFRDQPGRFAASFPEQPSKETSKEGIYSFAASGSKGSYSLLYVDLRSAEDARSMLSGLPESLSEGFGGKMTQSQNIRIGKHSGREFDFTTEAKHGGSGVGRAFSVDKRIYVILALGEKPEAKYFLNSFKLL
jgi:hypothetical protein